MTKLRHLTVLWCVSNFWGLQSFCKKCLRWRLKTLLLGNSPRKEVDQWTKQSLTHLTTHLTIQFDKLPRDTTWYILAGDNGKKCLIQYQQCTNQCNHVCNKSTSPVWGAWFRITCWQCQNISPFWLLSHVDLKSNYDDRSMSSTASAARGSL